VSNTRSGKSWNTKTEKPQSSATEEDEEANENIKDTEDANKSKSQSS